jgi:hypothetical protein
MGDPPTKEGDKRDEETRKTEIEVKNRPFERGKCLLVPVS